MVWIFEYKLLHKMSALILVQAMYIRVKRSKTTYFVQCDPTETILEIKQKLHALTDQPVNDQRLILVESNKILEDSKTLADQKVHSPRISYHLGLSFCPFIYMAHPGLL